jgi:phosphate-selective porin OprO/OprP
LTGAAIAALVLLSLPATAQQDTTDVIADGSTGEELEKITSDTIPEKWKHKRWRLFHGKYSTLKLGGGFLPEFASYSQDENSRRQMDSAGTPLTSAWKVRDLRVVASGLLKTKRAISWKAGFMYDGVTETWLVRETGITVGVPELWGSFFVGRTKEGFSLNKVMNGYSGWTMERQMAIDLIPILADGIKWLGFLPKQRILWNVGIYADWLSKNQGFSTYHWQWDARVGILPLLEEDKKKVIHVAFNYRYGEPENKAIRVRSRPEANPAPYFIDGGTFASDYSNHYGLEAYYRSGPLLLGTEVYQHQFQSVPGGSPNFVGGDVVATFMLTGETRPYNTATGIFGFVPVSRPVFKGGPGAWEIVLRYSSLDLTSGNVTGGKFWRITPMVNWYLSRDIRLELAYGYGVLDRFQLKGTTQFFQARVQFTLL